MTTEKLISSMCICEYFASIYHDAKLSDLGSQRTSTAYTEAIKTSLPDFYATVIVFSAQISEYFTELSWSMTSI